MAELKTNTQKITPFLWFNANAEEAATFYTSVFQHSHIKYMSHYGKDSPLPEGTVLMVAFQLDGQDFLALNGGPVFQFTEAISFMVNVDTQEELDYFWNKLSDGGHEVECGWLKDKFGLSWQIVPSQLNHWMQQPNTQASARVMSALLKMVKLDIALLEKAFNGETE